MDIIKLLIQIKNTYKKQANPEIAEGMSAYMKDKFDFFGIKKPLRNDLLKAYLPQMKNNLKENKADKFNPEITE